MSNRAFLLCVLIILFSRQMNLSGCDFRLENLNLEEIEEYLKTAKVISIEIKEDEGRTAPWEVILDDGKTKQRARFKHVRRSRPNNLPDSYHYEIAAYELTKLLGIRKIPPVIEREIDNTRGALQMYLEGCFRLSRQKREGRLPPDPMKFSFSIQELTVLENLTYCGRDSNDVLINEKDWHICRVDFSEAFAPEAKLIPELEITRCSRTFYKGLETLSNDKVESRLQKHLNAEEIRALLARKQLILTKINRLIKERGENEVLFD